MQHEQLEKINKITQQKNEFQTDMLVANLEVSQLKTKIAKLEAKLSDSEFKNVTGQNAFTMDDGVCEQPPPPPYVVERCDVEQQTDAIDVPQSLSPLQNDCLPPLAIRNDNNNGDESPDDESTVDSETVIAYGGNGDNDDDSNVTSAADQSICSIETSLLNSDVMPSICLQTVDDVPMTPSDRDHIEAIIESDMKMMTDPDVQREEELILFKEQCAKLTEDNVHLKRQMSDIMMKTNGVSANTLLAIGVPMVAVIIYSLFISPYL